MGRAFCAPWRRPCGPSRGSRPRRRTACSDLDALGGVLRLHGGRDEYARQRTVTRALLADTLHLPEVDAQNENALSTAPDAAEHADLADLRDWLYKDTDWMLPPGRYC